MQIRIGDWVEITTGFHDEELMPGPRRDLMRLNGAIGRVVSISEYFSVKIQLDGGEIITLCQSEWRLVKAKQKVE